MPLSPEAIVEINEYLEKINAVNEERAHKRLLRLTAIGGLLSAALAGLLILGINSTKKSITSLATSSAATEARAYIAGLAANFVHETENRLFKAEQDVVTAEADAEKAKKLAKEAETRLSDLDVGLGKIDGLRKALESINDLTVAVSKNSDFQRDVIDSLKPQITEIVMKA